MSHQLDFLSCEVRLTSTASTFEERLMLRTSPVFATAVTSTKELNPKSQGSWIQFVQCIMQPGIFLLFYDFNYWSHFPLFFENGQQKLCLIMDHGTPFIAVLCSLYSRVGVYIKELYVHLCTLIGTDSLTVRQLADLSNQHQKPPIEIHLIRYRNIAEMLQI